MDLRKEKDAYFVWVMAPFLETEDPNLKYYYDYTQSHLEYTKVFDEIGCEWKWVNVTMNTIEQTISQIENSKHGKLNLIINLCDGDELNGVPGISVIKALDRHQLIYTGSEEYFYDITTSKIPMKRAFDKFKVPTAPWKVVDPQKPESNTIFSEVGDVLIVKPAISAGSLGLGIKNVVDTPEGYSEIVNDMANGYRGWKLDAGGIFVEQFIQGREFTTFVVGSASRPDKIHFYPAIERVFHDSLPEKERFLSFDRLWLMFDKENPLPEDQNLYNYVEADASLQPTLKEISIEAFKSVGGTGYARLDIRMDTKTGKFYVLEVNAQCGLSEDEDYTSIGAILRFAKKSFTYLIIEILQDALMRHQVKQAHE